MEYTLAAIAVVVLLVITRRISYRAGVRDAERRLKPKPADVTIILQGSGGGTVTKSLNPSPALLYCEQDAIWAISNATDKTVTVDLGKFADKSTGRLKDPVVFQTKPIAIPPGEMRQIKGKVKDKTMFKADPQGASDAIGEYQDFLYSVTVDGQVLDPEVRIRQ